MWPIKQALLWASFAMGILLGSLGGAADVSYPRDLFIKDAVFRNVYDSLARGKTWDPWLRELSGVNAPLEYVSIGQDTEEFMLLSICKPHNCSVENAVILYSPKRRVAYAKVLVAGQFTTLGNPPMAISSDLDRLHL